MTWFHCFKSFLFYFQNLKFFSEAKPNEKNLKKLKKKTKKQRKLYPTACCIIKRSLPITKYGLKRVSAEFRNLPFNARVQQKKKKITQRHAGKPNIAKKKFEIFFKQNKTIKKNINILWIFVEKKNSYHHVVVDRTQDQNLTSKPRHLK